MPASTGVLLHQVGVTPCYDRPAELAMRPVARQVANPPACKVGGRRLDARYPQPHFGSIYTTLRVYILRL